MDNIDNITDEEINSFIYYPKNFANKENTKQEGKYRKRNISLRDERGNNYQIYLRQSFEKIEDFSCGLSLILEGGHHFTLIRCNGSSHVHRNSLEEEKLEYCCHIHKATQRYREAGKKIEGFAERTERYQTIEEAYSFLLQECHARDTLAEETLFGVDIWT